MNSTNIRFFKYVIFVHNFNQDILCLPDFLNKWGLSFPSESVKNVVPCEAWNKLFENLNNGEYFKVEDRLEKRNYLLCIKGYCSFFFLTMTFFFANKKEGMKS